MNRHCKPKDLIIVHEENHYHKHLKNINKKSLFEKIKKIKKKNKIEED